MNLRFSKTKDIEVALTIAKKLPGYFTVDAMNKMEDDFIHWELFIAEKDGKPVGFVNYQPINDEKIEMLWLGVDPEYQSQGIGKFLVDVTLKDYSSRYKYCEVKTLAATVEDDLYARTRKFYEDNGFVPTEIIDPYPGWDKGNPCQLYVKFLK